MQGSAATCPNTSTFDTRGEWDPLSLGACGNRAVPDIEARSFASHHFRCYSNAPAYFQRLRRRLVKGEFCSYISSSSLTSLCRQWRYYYQTASTRTSVKCTPFSVVAESAAPRPLGIGNGYQNRRTGSLPAVSSRGASAHLRFTTYLSRRTPQFSRT
jgi:hypothetical protein